MPNCEYFYGINQNKFIINLTKFFEDWQKFLKEEKNKYFEKFLKEGEKKKCNIHFLSKVLKYPENILLSTLYYSNITNFQDEIKKIRELYFEINPKDQFIFNVERVSDLINQTPSYILNRAFLCDELNFCYKTFINKIKSDESIYLLITQKQKNWSQDLQNDFLKLLQEASKEAFNNENDLFYYFLSKDFFYFKTFNHNKIKVDFIKQCNSIYRKKLEISDQSKFLFSHSMLNSLRKKFKDFHDNNDYKSKIQILEEKKEKYPNCFNNKINTVYKINPVINLPLDNLPSENLNNSHNANNENLQSYHQDNFLSNKRKIEKGYDYQNKKIRTEECILEKYNQNLLNVSYHELFKLRNLAIQSNISLYGIQYVLKESYKESPKSAFSIVFKRRFTQNFQPPYNFEYQNYQQENFNANNLQTNYNFHNR